MKETKKTIKLGLKNAIVVRTNIDPFKINDPDMEQVRGVWRCGERADKVNYFVGAVRLMPGKAKILGVWEIKSKPITIGDNFVPPKGWKRKIDWPKRKGRKISRAFPLNVGRGGVGCIREFALLRSNKK